MVARTTLVFFAYPAWNVAQACPNCAGILEGSEATAYLAVTGFMLTVPAVLLAALYGWLSRAYRSGRSAPDFSPTASGDLC